MAHFSLESSENNRQKYDKRAEIPYSGGEHHGWRKPTQTEGTASQGELFEQERKESQRPERKKVKLLGTMEPLVEVAAGKKKCATITGMMGNKSQYMRKAE